MKITWNEIENDLHNGILYDSEFEKFDKYIFLKQFDDLHDHVKIYFEKSLLEIEYICKVVSDWHYEDGRIYDFERFIPKIEYASNNRFNPPNKVFQYHGISYEANDGIKKRVQKTCLLEIKAKKNKEVSICEFSIDEKFKDQKIIDLTVGIDESYKSLEKKIFTIGKRINNMKQYSNDSHGVYWNELEKVMGKIYMKMLSDNLFRPVENNNKEKEYAPFHLFANYFEQKGYIGIVYESAVNKGNKNLVLFNTEYTKTIGKIENIINDYL